MNALTRRTLLQRSTWLGAAALPTTALVQAQVQTPTSPPSSLPAAPPELSGKQAEQDLRLLQRALVALHPGLTRYQTLAQMTADFDQAVARNSAGCSLASLFVQVSRLAANVRCGHTWASPYNQSERLRNSTLNRADKLPFTLRWVQGRAWVTGVMSSTAGGVETGDELLAINGQPMADIAAALLPCLRADGQGPDSDGKRWAQLDSGGQGGAMDRLFPLLMPPQAGNTYALQLRGAPGAAVRSTHVPAVLQTERDRALPPAPSSDWSLAVQGDTAVLTVPTFAFWRGNFDARAFINRSFDTLRTVPYLVIDQRRNEGGDDRLGLALLTHLLRAPASLPQPQSTSAYERAPYELARFLDTWNFGFFDRTGQVTPLPNSTDALPRYALPARPPVRIEPAAKPYAGRTVLLVGPENSSAGFLFAYAAKATGAATLLGQPTSGNQRGLNGGELAWITLPHSGVAVDIPLLAHIAAGSPPDAGVQPDLLVPPRFEDAQRGVDTQMLAAQALVGRWRSGQAG
jgi:Peptidase family S41